MNQVKSISTIRRLVFSLVCISVLLLPTLGCSVFMAAQQPDAKNLNVLDVGTPRGVVLMELGTPTWTEKIRGQRVDIFRFTQGYSKGAKLGRAFFHGAADVLTFGLWEVIGTPTESYFNGTKVGIEVTYSPSNRVETVRGLK